MLKVTYGMIAKHYKKSLAGVKYRAKKTQGVHSIDDLYLILNHYENKRTR